MVTDVNGMSHKPVGTVGGGQFEGKIGAASDDDLDALFEGGADLGAMRKAEEERAEEERRRERRKRAAIASANISVALQDRDVKRYVVKGILQNGKAVVEVPKAKGWNTIALLDTRGQDKAFEDIGLDPSYSLDNIRSEWARRGVDMKFAYNGKDSPMCVFYPKGDEWSPTMAYGTYLETERLDYDGRIPYLALNETERKVVDRQIEEWVKQDARLEDERYFSEETTRKIGESIKKYGVGKLPYPEGFDGEAYFRGLNGEFENSKGELTDYDFKGNHGRPTPMENALEECRGGGDIGRALLAAE